MYDHGDRRWPMLIPKVLFIETWSPLISWLIIINVYCVCSPLDLLLLHLSQISKSLSGVIDWGLSDFYYPVSHMGVGVGTRHYKPPESMLYWSFYDYSYDIWSLGTVFASMVVYASGLCWWRCAVIQEVSLLHGNEWYWPIAFLHESSGHRVTVIGCLPVIIGWVVFL